MAKTLFSEIFSDLTAELKLKDSIIGGNGKFYFVSVDTIRSWRSRGVPSKENIDPLIDRLIEITSQEKKEDFCNNIEEFVRKLQPIWLKYGVDTRDNALSSTDSFDDIIKTLITFAFDNSKRQGETDQPIRRLVAFDLDGTLIKGIRHSWTVLWQAIGKTSEDATRHKKDFEEGKLSYIEWCKTDLDALRAGGLTKLMVAEAAKKNGCSLTINLVEAIELLHKNNCKVVIISGGADCLLTALLPDADKVFDEICINKCVFGTDGVIANIVPTQYDWDADCLGVQGKEAGFRYLCAKYGAKPEDSVFVGDDRNDFRAMELAGMKIFYHSFSEYDATRGISKGAIKRDWPRELIIESRNDLMFVAKRILDWKFDD